MKTDSGGEWVYVALRGEHYLMLWGGKHPAIIARFDPCSNKKRTIYAPLPDAGPVDCDTDCAARCCRSARRRAAKRNARLQRGQCADGARLGGKIPRAAAAGGHASVHAEALSAAASR